VRRPVSLAKAAAIAQVPVGDLMPIIKAFAAPGRNFLVPPEPDPRAADKTMIDISHESLIRQWRTLKDWARAEASSAEQYRATERQARRCADRAAELWDGIDLAIGLAWRERDRLGGALWR